MQGKGFWVAALILLQAVVIIVLLIPGLRTSSGPDSAAQKGGKPFKVEADKASGLKRLTLTARAAERLDIKTAPLREQPLQRKYVGAGEVAASTAPDGLRVRVPYTGELTKVALDQPPLVLPLDQKVKEGTAGVRAKLVEPAGIDPAKAPKELVYAIQNGTKLGWAPEQRVRIEFVVAGSGAPRKVVAYSAVLYDPQGETWVFTSPEPLVFIRHRIAVDYIDGDLAVLSNGPPVGTSIVTMGGALLYGAERFGK